MRHALWILGLVVFFPRPSSADLALKHCSNAEAVLAQAMLAADVIVLARIEALDEKDQPTARGWSYSWSTRVKIEEVWKGRHPATTRFESSCSGTSRSSHNHCQRPPAGKGRRVVLFLKKGEGGKLYLAQPAFGVFGRCPADDLAARARKQDSRLFQRILVSTR